MEDKKVITPEKHPGRVAQGHKLAAFIKKRKEEILHNKEQSTEQPTVECSVQPTVKSSVQSRVQSNYVYGCPCILAVLAIGVCVYFTYNKKTGHEQSIKPRKRHML